MSDGVTTTLDSFLKEAQMMRVVPAMPDTAAGPGEVHEYLLNIRRRLDRTEHLLSTTLRLRGRCRRNATTLTQDADDQWDDAILRVRSAPVRRGDEYTSAKERSAEANLVTMTARRAAREATELAAACDEAVDVLRLIHNGLDGIRRDVLVLLRLVQFESHLER